MKIAIHQLDQRFLALRPLLRTQRPPKGWVRALRDALGMTTAQLAKRLDIVQSGVVELEQAELHGGITLKRLERVAEALGCRLVYVLVPEKPLSETVQARAERAAEKRVAAVEHTMRLENQEVKDKRARAELRMQAIEQLMRKPARLWDDE
jgi:predicted DNA-binding mobile mystery protein A